MTESDENDVRIGETDGGNKKNRFHPTTYIDCLETTIPRANSCYYLEKEVIKRVCMQWRETSFFTKPKIGRAVCMDWGLVPSYFTRLQRAKRGQWVHILTQFIDLAKNIMLCKVASAINLQL